MDAYNRFCRRIQTKLGMLLTIRGKTRHVIPFLLRLWMLSYRCLDASLVEFLKTYTSKVPKKIALNPQQRLFRFPSIET